MGFDVRSRLCPLCGLQWARCPISEIWTLGRQDVWTFGREWSSLNRLKGSTFWRLGRRKTVRNPDTSTWEGEASAVGRSGHLGGRGSCWWRPRGTFWAKNFWRLGGRETGVWSGHLGGRRFCCVHTSSLAGGAHNGLKGARFGVWVRGRPVFGLGTWEGDGSAVSIRLPWLVAPTTGLKGHVLGGRETGVWSGHLGERQFWALGGSGQTWAFRREISL